MKTTQSIPEEHMVQTFCILFLMVIMIPGVLAQETVPDEELEAFQPEELLKTNPSPDKSTPIMLNVVGGGARIHGLTVGKGGSNLDSNSAFGMNVLDNNTSGTYNTAIGRWALFSNTTGNLNIALGRTSLYSNTSGFSNVAIGVRALYWSIDRSNLVADGDSAL